MPRKGVRKLEREDEVRSLFIPEIRELGEGTEKESHIQGYALKFDEISEDMGFREIIARGALDNADMSDSSVSEAYYQKAQQTIQNKGYTIHSTID